MQFADPQELSTAYLILRDLYNGEVIDWPIADDHPLHRVFTTLEGQRLIARWDRMWPRRDRYRLTEAGIAAIEAAYRPEGAEQVFEELRGQELAPQDRRAYLAARGLDPTVWPLLHDPSTHWETYRTDGGRWLNYVWEDQRPAKRKRRPAPAAQTGAQAGAKTGAKAGAKTGAKTGAKPGAMPRPPEPRRPDDLHDDAAYRDRHRDHDQLLVVPYLVDLDQEASRDPIDVSLDQPDLDVS